MQKVPGNAPVKWKQYMPMESPYYDAFKMCKTVRSLTSWFFKKMQSITVMCVSWKSGICILYEDMESQLHHLWVCGLELSIKSWWRQKEGVSERRVPSTLHPPPWACGSRTEAALLCWVSDLNHMALPGITSWLGGCSNECPDKRPHFICLLALNFFNSGSH